MSFSMSALGGFRLRAALALIAVGGFLLFLVFKNETARDGGEEITLETRPIDPRDIFFGYYAVFDYDIRTRNPEQTFAIMDVAFRADAEAAFATSETGTRYSNINLRSDRTQNKPAYIVLKIDGAFHVADFATLDLAKARESGAPFVRADWSVTRHFIGCEEGGQPGNGCDWQTTISPQLPSRYYADGKTARALEDRQRDAQRIAAAQRRFGDCARQPASADETDAPPEGCEDADAPSKDAERFGVVLSTSDRGEAVIKGIVFGDQKAIDSLAGPRLTKEQLD